MIVDRIIPRAALRWGRLTRPWPALDVWCRANPALNNRVLPERLWEYAVTTSGQTGSQTRDTGSSEVPR